MKAELQTRLFQFSKSVIEMAQWLPINIINRNTIDRCVECSTNAGAEYAVANVATTKKTFSYGINMCKSHLQAAQYWLELLNETTKDNKKIVKEIYSECKELADIFQKISWKLKKPNFETEQK